MKPNDKLETPMWVWKPLGPFDLDPCAGAKTQIASISYRLEDGMDGLAEEWQGFVWCNPPFSQKMLWAGKMAEHSNGILCLPERGSAPWFTAILTKCRMYFVLGKKINFIGGSSSNNVGTVLFLFGETAYTRIRKANLPGHLVSVQLINPRR